MDTFRNKLAVFLDPINWFIFVFAGSLIAPNTEILAFLGLSLWVPIIVSVLCKKYPPLEVLFQSEIKLLLLFALYILISLLWSPLDAVLLSKEVVRVLVSIALITSFSYWIRSGAFKNTKVDDFLILFAVVSSLVLVGQLVCAILTESTAVDHKSYGEFIVSPGIFYHPETVGWFFGMTFLLVLARFVDERSENWMGTNNVTHILILSVALASISMLLVLSQSGATFLGVVLGLMYQFIFLSPKSKRRMLMVMGCLVFVVFIANLYLKIPISISMFAAVDVDRSDVWRNGLDLISDAQFFGHGFGASSILTSLDGFDSQSMHLHSVYLSVLFYGGVTGLLILLFFVISVFSNNWRVKECRAWFSIWLMGLIIFLFDGNHIITYLSSELYIFLLPVAVMLALRVRQEINEQ